MPFRRVGQYFPIKMKRSGFLPIKLVLCCMQLLLLLGTISFACIELRTFPSDVFTCHYYCHVVLRWGPTLITSYISKKLILKQNRICIFLCLLCLFCENLFFHKYMLVIANVSVFSHEGSDPGTSDFCYLVIFKSQEKHSCCSCVCKNCKMLSKNELLSIIS